MAVAYISWAALAIPAHTAGAESVSVAETCAALDVRSAVVLGIVAGTVPESAAATDTPSAIETRLATVAEILTPLDASTGIVGGVLGPVAETVTATDIPSAIETRLATVAESATANAAQDGSVTSGVAKRGYISWARLTIPIQRPAQAASISEAATMTATTAASGGGSSVAMAEALAAADHPASGGGGTIAAIVPEATSSIDIATAVLATRVYLSFADLQFPSPSQAVSVAEILAATDAPSNTADRFTSVAEIIAALATTSAAGSIAAVSIAEVVAATDTLSAIGGATLASVAESMTAIDDQNGIGGVTSITQAEICTAADSTDAPVARPVAVSESLSATDATDAIASAFMTESMTAADSCAAVLIAEGSIAEGTAGIEDTAAAAALWEMFVSETLTPADDADVLNEIPPLFEDASPGRMARGALIGGRLGIAAPTGTTTAGKLD
jgi:hypothetical protein